MILDTETCAALLRCSVPHLQKLARDGDIPATKVGRGWIFVSEEILQWLKNRRAKKRGRPRRPTTSLSQEHYREDLRNDATSSDLCVL